MPASEEIRLHYVQGRLWVSWVPLLVSLLDQLSIIELHTFSVSLLR